MTRKSVADAGSLKPESRSNSSLSVLREAIPLEHDASIAKEKQMPTKDFVK